MCKDKGDSFSQNQRKVAFLLLQCSKIKMLTPIFNQISWQCLILKKQKTFLCDQFQCCHISEVLN